MDQSYPVIDGHVDLLYSMYHQAKNVSFQDIRKGPLTFAKLEKGRVAVFVSAFYLPDSYNGPNGALPYFQRMFEYARKYTSSLPVITSTETLFEGWSRTRPGGMLYLLENGDVLLEQDPATLREKGFYIVGLTHMGSNRLGDGNNVASPRGLTAEGKKMLKTLHTLGYALDTAHLSPPAFFQAMDIFSGPVCSSHTGLRRFHDIPRNLSDDQVRILAERQGVIGLTFAPEMLAGKAVASLEEVVRHIDWIVQKHGPSHVGLGSDFGGFDGVCRGLETPGGFQKIALRLEKLGYEKQDIAGIMGANWYTFYAQLLP